MSIFHRYGLPLLIVGAVFLITILLPEDKRIQVIAPLITGVTMFVLYSLLGKPDVVIEDLGEEVAFSLASNRLWCSIHASIVNKSATGSAELKELVLRIYLAQGCLNVPLEKAEDINTNYRFLPHGRYPIDTLSFALDPLRLPINTQDIAGRKAEIRLQIVGQRIRNYEVKMSGKTN